jgi:hypothetical protein
MSYSQDQLDADAKLVFSNHWVGCLHQGLLINPIHNCLDDSTCYGATVLEPIFTTPQMPQKMKLASKVVKFDS